jgi:uncharacterized protein YqkB
MLDDDPPVFENYVHAAYFGPFPHDICDHHLDALSKMWVLADKLIDIKTANLVMDAIHDYYTEMCEFAGSSSFNLVYESTGSGDTVIYSGWAGWFCEDPSEYHFELYRDIAVEYMAIQSKSLELSKTFKDIFGETLVCHMPPSRRYHLRDLERTPSSK